MGAGVKSIIQAEEPTKRLNRLRSVKLKSLDKFRLSMKRTKSRLSQEIVLPEPEELMELNSKQKQSPTSKIHDSPNYMKATSCFNARSGSSPLNPGVTSIARKTTKGTKRMYSLKRVRKIPAGNVEEVDFEGATEVAPAKLKLIRSGSIKISRVRSLKLGRRQLSKSRFDQASISMTDDDDDQSAESDSQKTTNTSSIATSLKPIRTLYKMPSLRSRRRQQPVKKQSRFAESKATHFDQATCSWAIKSSKIQQAETNHVSGKCESESQLTGHICPYTYCSFHGHQHSPSPPLKGFISTKRRLLKKQRSIRFKNRLKTESSYRDASRLKQSVEEHEEKNDVEIYKKLRDASTTESSIGGESRQEDADSITSDVLDEQSSGKDSTNILLDSRKYANMWKLIYKQLSVPGSEALSEDGEKGKEENENQDVNLENQVADGENLEFNQTEAIEFVQQAVDEILQLDEQSPLFPITPKELKDIVPEKPRRQRSKGFEKLRKMMNTAKFVKAVEKLRKINPRKSRFLSLEEQSEMEKVQLRRLVMDGKKNSEEWMLDFALQQVIAKLAPSQKRRVDVLVKAFERVTPEERSIVNPDEENHIHPENVPEEYQDNDKQELKSDIGNENEETNYQFDKEKFTNVWHMVYRQFIAQEESASTISSSNGSSSSLDQDVNQGDAIQLVQEAIDELLHLHEQLSEQQTPKSSKVAEEQNKVRCFESTEETDNQKGLQRQTSKPLSRLKKLILSAKFIKTMEKLRKIRTEKTEEFCSHGGEKVFLRRSSTDERRNGEDWMLDNTLQDVISKLAPAQQKRVVLLTRAFETFTPELEQMSRRYSKVKMQPEDRTSSLNKLDKEEDKFVIVDHDTPINRDVPIPEDEAKDASFQVNAEGFSDTTQTEYKESDFKIKLGSHQEKTLIDSQDEEKRVNDPRYVLSEGKYSKMWQLLCQHVKSNTSADIENQTTETDDASIRAEETKDATIGKLEFTQSDVNKLVQDALDGILEQPSINTLAANEYKKLEFKSDRNALPKYSRWKRAIICSKFIAAMERMQKLYTHKKRSQSNPLISYQEAEIVHLRKCLTDERSSNEVWMLDYALRQAIAKLAPVQQRKVSLLIEAFETVTPNTEEETTDTGKGIFVESDWSCSTGNDQDSPSRNTQLQQKKAIKLVEEAVNEIFDIQVQSTDLEEKAVEEDDGQKEVQRTYNVMSKVITCKKFIKAMERMKKSKPKVKRNLPHRMDDKNCEEWMLDYALQQVIGKMAPTQKKKVSLLVEAFERVNPPPDSIRNQRFNVAA